MKIIIVVLVAVLGCLPILGPAQAADNCKECRDFHRACLTAHSKAACKTDYDICMKHCRQSSLLHPETSDSDTNVCFRGVKRACKLSSCCGLAGANGVHNTGTQNRRAALKS